jgi:phosphatidylglycerophosphatase A
VGTLVGIPLYLVFSAMSWPLWLLSIIAFACLSWYVSDEAERIFGQKDPRLIVIDEIAGLQCTLFLIEPKALYLVVGFVLFRIFDVVKPFPVRWFQDRLPGGLGVTADDLAAGVYAHMVLRIMMHWGWV